MKTPITLSTRMNGVVESSTLKMNMLARELAASGKKVINLTAGEPDFPILEVVKVAAIDAIRADFSRYTPVAGIPELRQAVSRKFKKDNELDYPAENIVVSLGAKQAIYNFLMAMVSPGDEVLIPSPYWVSYPEMVKLAGGVPVILRTTEQDGFKLKPDQLKKAIGAKTKVLLLNSPSNPTGVSYSESEMRGLASCLEGTNVWVLSDEIYEKLIYQGKFCSFASLSSDAFSRTITVNGFSKAYAMTGWRLGYAAGPKEIIAAMTLLQGQSTSGAHSATQKAAVTALNQPESVFTPMVEAYRRRRDRMAEIFAGAGDRVSFVTPNGAFYLFLNIERCLGKRYNSSEDFAFFLLDSAQVVTVPGGGFGADGYLRLSFAVADRDVEEGCTKIVSALRSI